MNTIVNGLQWGDEGKGKIVDYLTENADFVVRGQGGNNAGHTVIVGENKYILHLVPSGILWPGKQNVIGNGVVLDPIGLAQEIATLEGQGVTINPDNLLISDRAHVVLPYHCDLDAAQEQARGKFAIGTTRRGIGPAYSDKATRNGLRLADLLDPEMARELVSVRLEDANQFLDLHNMDSHDPTTVLAAVEGALERLRPHVTNTIPTLHQAWKAGRNIVFEGAQGTFLDVDFVDVAMAVDPATKMVSKGTMEKQLLRDAFTDLLPEEVVKRQKEQFGDGVGYSWIDSLKSHASARVSDVEMRNAAVRFPYSPPATKEAYYYRAIFEGFFPLPSAAACVPGGPSIACSTPEAMAWDATFAAAADPSGRAVRGVHEEAI